jgi:hypothetical protein
LDVKHVDEELHVAENVLPLALKVVLVERVLAAKAGTPRWHAKRWEGMGAWGLGWAASGVAVG